MSNQGIRGFYQVTDTLKTQLLSDVNCKTVTTGDISQVNLNKQDIFPLSHIIINSVTQSDDNGSSTYTFNVSILSMDIVNQSKEPTTDLFVGNNNVQDILNTQMSVSNKVIQLMRGGTLFQTMYQVTGDANFEFFEDRFENQIAGVTATFNITIWNDIYTC
jgi:hypothetical protein|tara:strand:- start:264 stop:746 length:483 start_codon:yes stop_codon:yes gene_type:complete